jgi:hypothetical protein
MELPGDGTEWSDEIRVLNALEQELRPVDNENRKIRAHIGSLVACDSGFPVTMDEILNAIGRGSLVEPSFHDGCWAPAMWWEEKSTQPRHVECMRAIEATVLEYLNGASERELVRRFPDAARFVGRVFRWLGPLDDLSRVQKLMLERMLLPFEYWTQRTTQPGVVLENCFKDGGRGRAIDAEIAREAGLPEIENAYGSGFRKAWDSIPDPSKRDLYEVCGALAHGLHTLADCHHSSFRWIENWLHGIGTGRLSIPERLLGTERTRLGSLLFGYALGLDQWLLGRPMQWLLLDLAYVDLGFDPKNEIVRVYAYLGESRTPVKVWLAGCLWHNLVRSRPAGLDCGRDHHRELLARAEHAGVSVREWMDRQLTLAA